MANLRDLETHLVNVLPNLKGDWVKRSRKYEEDFAKRIGAIHSENRYWDCIWKDIYIELKKGNVWLDLVRYSEFLLHTTPESKITVTTLFLKYKQQKITDIYAVRIENLIRALNLSEEMADMLIKINNAVPRSLNAQASLSKSDIGKIAEFHIK